ncbi:MAG: dihydroneopterin aldolase [Acidimicrobiales bacterium]
MGSGGTGCIQVRDLRAVGTHGVLAEERERAQPFSLDLDVWLDARAAGRSDDLADTVDYGPLAQMAAETVASTSVRLLEALAAEVARRVVGADRRISAVSVTVRKVRPPVPMDVASIGVNVVLERDRE